MKKQNLTILALGSMAAAIAVGLAAGIGNGVRLADAAAVTSSYTIDVSMLPESLDNNYGTATVYSAKGTDTGETGIADIKFADVEAYMGYSINLANGGYIANQSKIKGIVGFEIDAYSPEDFTFYYSDSVSIDSASPSMSGLVSETRYDLDDQYSYFKLASNCIDNELYSVTIYYVCESTRDVSENAAGVWFSEWDFDGTITYKKDNLSKVYIHCEETGHEGDFTLSLYGVDGDCYYYRDAAKTNKIGLRVNAGGTSVSILKSSTSVNGWTPSLNETDLKRLVASQSVTVSADATTICWNSATYNNNRTSIKAVVSPSNATYKEDITWTMSEEGIVTIANDDIWSTSITGVAPGTVRLTATTADGVAGYVDITVRDAVSASSIQIVDKDGNDAGSAASVGAGKTLSLSAKLDDDATERSVTWSSSDNSVATVSLKGVVSGVKAGTATITASSGSVSDTIVITVTGDESAPIYHAGSWSGADDYSGEEVTFVVPADGLTGVLTGANGSMNFSVIASTLGKDARQIRFVSDDDADTVIELFAAGNWKYEPDECELSVVSGDVSAAIDEFYGDYIVMSR